MSASDTQLQVLQVRKKDNKKIYALKVLQKQNIINRNQVEHTRTERQVLGYIRHPFIVGLNYAFQVRGSARSFVSPYLTTFVVKGQALLRPRLLRGGRAVFSPWQAGEIPGASSKMLRGAGGFAPPQHPGLIC